MDQLIGRNAEGTENEKAKKTTMRTRSRNSKTKFAGAKEVKKEEVIYSQVNILEDQCPAGRKSIVNKFDDNTKNESNITAKAECKSNLKAALKNVCKSEKAVTENENDLHVQSWLPGDMVWGQVGNYPFWPGIIMDDPKESTFMKICSSRRKYHMQFFNDNGARSWLSTTSILEYKGVEEFETMRKKKTTKAISGCTPKVQKKWKEAVEEAEVARGMIRNERVKWFSEKYAIVVETNEQTKGEAVSKPSESPSVKRGMKEGNLKKDMKTDDTKKCRKGVDVMKDMKGNDVYKDVNENYVKTDMKKDSVKKVRKEDGVKVKIEKLSNEEPQKLAKCSLKRMGDNINKDSAPIKKIVVNQSGTPIKKEDVAPVKKRSVHVILGDFRAFYFRTKDRFALDYPEASEEELFRFMESNWSMLNEPLKRHYPTWNNFPDLPFEIQNPSIIREFQKIERRARKREKEAIARRNAAMAKKTEKKVEIFRVCFVCETHTGDECSCNFRLKNEVCDKFYHLDCLKNFPHVQSSGKTVTCPRHVCHTCISRDVKINFTHLNLVTCVKCPTSYHIDGYCVPAGTEIVDQKEGEILCIKHFETNQKNHINGDWCFVCVKGGFLINCQTCPAAYHAECIGISHPEGSFLCQDCQSGRSLMCGELVWTKLSYFNWWPAMIIPSHAVPSHLTKIPHQQGDFAVEFFGTRDGQWMNRGRTFSYTKKMKNIKNPDKMPVYALALEEAWTEFGPWKRKKSSWEDAVVCLKRPLPYRWISRSTFVPPVCAVEFDESKMTSCECGSLSEGHPCGPESNCINRKSRVECSPCVCKLKNCENQRFQTCAYSCVTRCWVQREQRWAFFSRAEIHKGDFVTEYVGEVIDKDECKRRLNENCREKNYCLQLDTNHFLDAEFQGNLSRFMVPSSDPNCELQKWTVSGNVRLGVFAITDIEDMTELTCNFQAYITQKEFSLDENVPSCSGQNSAKKRKQQNNNPEQEDLCFQCHEGGGELITCDGKTCAKKYHLHCVGPVKKPRGRWLCTRHSCDLCGSRVVQMCHQCPKSYCKQHKKPYKTLSSCRDHE